MNKPKQRGSRRVLTKAELEALLDVPTTVEDARMILERNKLALTYLRLGDGFKHMVNVSCPHCVSASPDGGCFQCSKCAYNDKSTRKHHEPQPLACICYTFGGFSFEDLEEEPGCEPVLVLRKRCMEVRAPLDRPTPDEERFLLGHIEWAKEVIRRARVKRGGAG